jgi:hypothetical protein
MYSIEGSRPSCRCPELLTSTGWLTQPTATAAWWRSESRTRWRCGSWGRPSGCSDWSCQAGTLGCLCWPCSGRPTAASCCCWRWMVSRAAPGRSERYVFCAARRSHFAGEEGATRQHDCRCTASLHLVLLRSWRPGVAAFAMMPLFFVVMYGRPSRAALPCGTLCNAHQPV